MRESIALMIQQFAAEKPETAAVIVNDETCTYAQLASANRKAARWLQEKGIRPGDRIIVEADHILDYVYFWYGLQLLGACFVPVEKDTPSNRIVEIGEELQTGYMVTLKAREDLPQAWALSEIMPQILELSDEYEAQIPDPESLSEILFTTGTTGKS